MRIRNFLVCFLLLVILALSFYCYRVQTSVLVVEAYFDLSVRREVAEMLPHLFKQIVVFITSSERKGFADQYYDQLKECNFLTVSKQKDNVRLVNDLDFFKNFQSEGQYGI